MDQIVTDEINQVTVHTAASGVLSPGRALKLLVTTPAPAAPTSRLVEVTGCRRCQSQSLAVSHDCRSQS